MKTSQGIKDGIKKANAAREPMPCDNCGTMFQPASYNAKYCESCRVIMRHKQSKASKAEWEKKRAKRRKRVVMPTREMVNFGYVKAFHKRGKRPPQVSRCVLSVPCEIYEDFLGATRQRSAIVQ